MKQNDEEISQLKKQLTKAQKQLDFQQQVFQYHFPIGTRTLQTKWQTPENSNKPIGEWSKTILEKNN